jgi:hypothetical protein
LRFQWSDKLLEHKRIDFERRGGKQRSYAAQRTADDPNASSWIDMMKKTNCSEHVTTLFPAKRDVKFRQLLGSQLAKPSNRHGAEIAHDQSCSDDSREYREEVIQLSDHSGLGTTSRGHSRPNRSQM